MDTNSQETNESFKDQLVVDEIAKGFLKTAIKWSQFLSILGFITCGLGALFFWGISLFLLIARGLSEEMDYALGNMPIGFMSGGYFIGGIICVISIIPSYFLYKFSSKTKKALFQNNSLALTEALKSFKSYYQFVGIFTIAVIVLYIIFIVIVLLYSMSQSFNAY